MTQTTLFNVPISMTTKCEALEAVGQWVMDARKNKKALPKIITTPNPEMIVAAKKDPAFLHALQQADLALPDGWGVVITLQLLLKDEGQRQKAEGQTKENLGSFVPRPSSFVLSRISGIDFMELLVAEAVKRKWSVVFLGGKPGIAISAAHALQIENCKLNIASFPGPVDVTNVSQEEQNQLISSINSLHPDLLFVAFGHGKQEKWMVQLRKQLRVGVMMGVGGAFDQFADPSLRPPKVLDHLKLGWLYRLFREPWRWRRQLSLVTFFFMVVRRKFQSIAAFVSKR